MTSAISRRFGEGFLSVVVLMISVEVLLFVVVSFPYHFVTGNWQGSNLVVFPSCFLEETGRHVRRESLLTR